VAEDIEKMIVEKTISSNDKHSVVLCSSSTALNNHPAGCRWKSNLAISDTRNKIKGTYHNNPRE
jgi:hypothetical protein